MVRQGVQLPAHAAFETYSVLTRLPRPHRASPGRVLEFLETAFHDGWLTLPSSVLLGVLRELAERGVTGGATYDGLIGMAARHVGTTLITRDRRALATYERLGVEVQLLD